MSEPEEATLSLPSIAIVAVLGFIIYRYFFSSGNNEGNSNSNSISSSTSSSSTAARNGMRFTMAQVNQVSGMFPQLSRRDIMWDLQRNRGSVPSTIDQVLSGRGLQTAPPSFQPQDEVAPAPAVPLTAAIRAVKPEPDLITRYNLQSRVDSKGKGKEKEEVSSGWASTKEQRQSMLQHRRDEMILAARRKMQEKEAQNAPAATS